MLSALKDFRRFKLVNHVKWMKIALDLSKKQLGKTGENPSVGCIIVKNNKVIASGVT